ncbi:esterase/lipase family protein [Streptomyces sp. RPT161]|uniref:esterase/lipase family protein n=1 Tax=Streptomyces sp. RPT161 TaxID=3015993 RepID=UPI0022B8608F|nr:triacylglycerol lipase [Streptomyces sp. RPT161]
MKRDHLGRALAALLATALATATLSAVTSSAPAQAAPAEPDPVVFVHGRNAGPGVWGGMMTDFTAAGYPQDRLFAWSYDTSQSTNEVLSGQLSSYVDTVLARTGATRVDIVAHSLGSLPTRWYIKFGGGARKVAHWASLAGPNHGTSLAYLCALWDQGCRDMTPGSYVVQHLDQGAEAPGPVRYATWWSPCDEQVSPPTSTELTGAANTETGCLKHNDFLSDRTVSEQVLAFLRTATAH